MLTIIYNVGIQICAILGEVTVISKSLKGSKPALVLSMAWSPDDKSRFEISITSLTPITMDLGSGVVTDPISIHLILDKTPKLGIRTGAVIKTGEGEESLHFIMQMEIGALGITATGQLAGGWKNPMGLCPELTIGPNLALKLDFLYATGPSGIGFVGGMQVGKKNGQLAFEVNEVPSRTSARRALNFGL